MTFDGYAVARGRYTVAGAPRPRYLATLAVWVLALGAALGVLNQVDQRVEDAATRYVCPPDCGRPPTALPAATNPRFVAADGAFSVSYPAPGAAYVVTTEPDGVIAQWTAGDGGTLRLFGEPAAGRTAQQVVGEFMAGAFPDSVVSYELPNATVGYQLGFGVVCDYQPPGESDPLRVIVIAAVKDDLALVAAAQGPFRRFSPGFGPGPPSAANLSIAQDMGKYVDSFTWRGDPPR
ncbi:MAG: hypothetical protein ACKOD2_18645 [Ilumatobacteraceae bacterium]